MTPRLELKPAPLDRVTHRPWDLPPTPWTWRQSWRDLLFAHSSVKAAAVQPFVPPPLRVQVFDGTSWIGLVPFRMAGVMRRPLPDLPWVSAFPELNVRLYVEHDGKPGVWFLSLDATNPLAIWLARRLASRAADLPRFSRGPRVDRGVVHALAASGAVADRAALRQRAARAPYPFVWLRV